MEQRLSVVTLGVENVELARRFYESLGWTCANDKPEIAFFQLNGMVLALYAREGLAEDAALPVEPAPVFGGVTLAYNTRTKEEVDAVFALAVRSGAKVLKLPQDAFWGGYSGYFADPDGHPWEIVWNPQWHLDAVGALHMR